MQGGYLGQAVRYFCCKLCSETIAMPALPGGHLVSFERALDDAFFFLRLSFSEILFSFSERRRA
jgi:hypothetical protein